MVRCRALLESAEFVVFRKRIQSLPAAYTALAPSTGCKTAQPTVDCRSPFARRKMPKFVIEREIPGAGDLSPEQLHAISQTSCGVLRQMGPEIQWVESFVTDDKIYCVYIAQDEQMVREHAQKGGFPANKVSQVRSIIDPTTSE
jgi:hypothetical protein